MFRQFVTRCPARSSIPAGCEPGCASPGGGTEKTPYTAANAHREDAMDLPLTDKHRALQAEVQAFIRTHGQDSPKPGGGRKRPDRKTLDWQKKLVEHGYAARTVPRDY